MQTQKKIGFAVVKVKLNFFFIVPMLLLVLSVGPSPNTFKKLFLQLSAQDDKLLSTIKITKFPAKSLPKLHETAPSNHIP